MGKPHVQIEFEADKGAVREYNEREAVAARRITAILLAEAKAQDSERQDTRQPPTPPPVF